MDMTNQTMLKQAIYRKQSTRGRAWEIQILGDTAPILQEVVEVLKKDGKRDHVWVTSVDYRGGGIFCAFRTKERDVGSDSAQRLAIAGEDFMGSDSDTAQTAQESASATQTAGESFDVAAVRNALKAVVMDVYGARNEAAQSAHKAEGFAAQAEITAKITAKRLPEMAAQAFAEAAAKAIGIRVEYVDISGKITQVGRQHKEFPKLLKWVSVGLNVWLPGPAGSGKTTAAEYVAKALSLSFYHSGKVLMEHQLIGYKDAHGNYHRTPFREAYENGGLFLQDEADASEAKALLALNMAIENQEMAFPDGIVKRHKDFRLIAAANTFGQGADSDYVGRNQQDKAFLDRFVFLPWGYDADFERHLALCKNPKAGAWIDTVQTYRQRAKEKGIKVLITPRASIYGAIMLAAGVSMDEAKQALIRKGMTDQQWQSIN